MTKLVNITLNEEQVKVLINALNLHASISFNDKENAERSIDNIMRSHFFKEYSREDVHNMIGLCLKLHVWLKNVEAEEINEITKHINKDLN